MTAFLRRSADTAPSPVSRRSLLAASGAASAAIMLAACGNGTPSGGAGSAAPTTGQASAGSDAGANAGTFDPDVPYLVFGAGSVGPKVELFVDYRCPHCKNFSLANHDYLEQAVDAGTIELHVYPRPMLDARTGTTFSRDTATAVVATYVQDPALFWDLDTALFALQPESGTDPTPGTQAIADAAESVGANEATVQAILDSEYTEWVQSVEEVGRERNIGTPVVFINGEQFEGDIYTPGPLQKAIEAAAAHA